ncbi:hypothetical protein IGB42_01588 [Andreprevotia sp. IGB-42]|uniref:AzlD domain-containing protein n=1 Tax=Andreprevotia sp. IGB-42 TaxID=2497473 RepID=UPI00135AA06A|nr:AzlD domain-containing protein [Andreprevotia sp. IGB-42]KAF0813909.1 hypothetical protein IGB42_01588 [Andreprevotia sp. IGB-42]
MSNLTTTILLMGLVVLSIRGVAFMFADRIVLPAFFKECLELFLPAILTVLIVSGLSGHHGGNGNVLRFLLSPHVLAALVCIALSLRLKSFFAVVMLSYLSFLAFHFLLPQI